MTMQLVLGTAQFGMNYGISNPGGRPSSAEVAEVLRRAHAVGVRTLDTAALYGDAEQRLGELAQLSAEFAIVTKTTPVGAPPVTAADAVKVRETFKNSLRQLRRQRVQGLLVHHAADLLAEGGQRLWEVLVAAREQGQADRIGVSVYCPEQAERVLDRFGIQLIQLPMNLLDRRFQQSGTLRRLIEAGVLVHARSPFLQGLLLMDPNRLNSFFDPVQESLRRFHEQARCRGLTPVEAAIGYVRTMPEISGIVVGVVSAAQLAECAEAMQKTIAMDYHGSSCDDPRIVEPWRWELT